jgi:MOSC domain-containing protein YiiM
MMRLTAEVIGLFVGTVAPLVPGKPPSAIAKQLVTGPLVLTPTGFVTDEQADLTVHGGFEKAVHHYDASHYAMWRDELGVSAAHLKPGSFGENISTHGLTEDTLCIGDVLTMGGATVQISQGRQPCWKLNAHTGLPQLAMLFQRTLRTGWYYRVLTPGAVTIGDEITLTARPHPEWSVARVTKARLSAQTSPTEAALLADLAALAPGWRAAFLEKAQHNTVEDTSRRLNGG